MADQFSLGEMIMWPIRIAIVATILGGFVLIETRAIDSVEDVLFQEANQLSSRFLYNSNCLMKVGYHGEKHYVYTLIDPEKFNSNNLLKCNSRKGFSAKVSLEYGNKNKEAVVETFGGDFGVDSRACFDSKRFGCVFSKYYVLVYDDGEIVPGHLSINGVLRKNV